MSEKRRFINKISYMLCVCLLLTLCTLLSACSDDDALNDPTRASIMVTHNIEARTLSNNVKTVRYYCFNREGYRTFGPANLAKAPQVLLQAVPADSVSISMTYFNSDSKIIGFYSQRVQLKVGEVYKIDDPAWEDIDSISNLNRIKILQKDYRVHTEDDFSFASMAEFTDTVFNSGKKYLQIFTDNCDWMSSDRAVIDNLDEGADEGTSLLGKKDFESKKPGRAVISASFYNYSDKADIEVTDAVITDVKLDVSSLVLPLNLAHCVNHLTASWSDGKTSCVDCSSSWTTSDNDIASAYYSFIVPRKASTSAEDTEGEQSTKTATITASVLCDDESLSDSCIVTVVNGGLTGISLDAEAQSCAVGEKVPYIVSGTYSRQGHEAVSYPLDWLDYTITNSDPSVASSDDNLITGLKPGTTVLKAVSDENSSFTDSLDFAVTEADEATD